MIWSLPIQSRIWQKRLATLGYDMAELAKSFTNFFINNLIVLLHIMAKYCYGDMRKGAQCSINTKRCEMGDKI